MASSTQVIRVESHYALQPPNAKYISIVLLTILLTLTFAVEPNEATIQVRRKGKPDAIRCQQPRRSAFGRAMQGVLENTSNE